MKNYLFNFTNKNKTEKSYFAYEKQLEKAVVRDQTKNHQML